MRTEKTLREITEQFGVTRRAIQGYEKNGLVTASGKNKYGYLLYDGEALKKILQIKQYQEFGFSLKEIAEFIGASIDVRKEMLKRQITKAEIEQVQVGRAISEMKQMVRALDEMHNNAYKER